ncbi:response regulator transcription factor [Thiomicrospira microaerophila]|uniref:response regulator transcription factor n=1 Tax=Thiomicrospira microaerophila TaxID=406020 RepID=UPI0005C9F3DC|nr:response regulator transcription factor [Thiomicrospira microaerophila]
MTHQNKITSQTRIDVCVLTSEGFDGKKITQDLQAALSQPVETLNYPALEQLQKQNNLPNILLLCTQDSADKIDQILSKLENEHTGIIVLISAQSHQHQLKYLTLGADVCIETPLNIPYLKAQIARLQVRVKQIRTLDRLILEANQTWRLNRDSWLLTAPNRRATMLTPTEYAAIELLADIGHTKPVSRHLIAQTLKREMCENYEKYINTLISRIKRKVLIETGCQLNIKAYRSEGYVITNKIKII